MNIIESLLSFLKKDKSQEENATPEGMCPNCWGREEYGGKFYERVQQENLNVNSKESNVGWVSAYANKHLMGIALQRRNDGKELVCQKCKTSFAAKD